MNSLDKEVWIDMVKEGMYPDSSFLAASVDMSEFVEYNKINLAEAGVDPNVLIDNTTYPVATVSRTDVPKELALHTFDTENTVVRNVEAKMASYNKMDSVVRGHRNSLRKKTSTWAAHSWAPNANGVYTPVSASTGATSNGRKKITFDDIMDLNAKFMSLDVDRSELIAVLNPFHLMDLKAEDGKLYKEMMSDSKLFDFKIYGFSQLPFYNGTTGVKQSFGAANDANSQQASLFYVQSEVMRAEGTYDMFATLKDPGARGDIIGFQQRFTALPIRSKYQAAIYSAKV